MKLRTIDYLSNIQEYNGCSISANLKCNCGCETFSFHFKGKQTKGIFAPCIIKLRNQLVLKCTCEHCNASFILYDSSIDGSFPKTHTNENNFFPFVLPSSDHIFHKVVVKYNYFPDKMNFENQYSNQFENCFIYILNKNGKEKALIEE